MAKRKTPRRPPTHKARRAAATPPPEQFVAPVSIVHQMDQDELDNALATGRHREALEEYFGPELYRELSVLAADAQRHAQRGGPPVAILPGIMGSELSIRQGSGAQVIWLSILQVVLGRTRALKLGGGGDSTVHATGVWSATTRS